MAHVTSTLQLRQLIFPLLLHHTGTMDNDRWRDKVTASFILLTGTKNEKRKGIFCKWLVLIMTINWLQMETRHHEISFEPKRETETLNLKTHYEIYFHNSLNWNLKTTSCMTLCVASLISKYVACYILSKWQDIVKWQILRIITSKHMKIITH
jgi:hypothetical protein